VSEQRKNQRFELKLPIELVKAGGEGLPQVGETRNLSSGGVLFTADGRLQKGDPIEYLVTLPAQGEETALRAGAGRFAASICNRGHFGTARVPAAVTVPNSCVFLNGVVAKKKRNHAV